MARFLLAWWLPMSVCLLLSGQMTHQKGWNYSNSNSLAWSYFYSPLLIYHNHTSTIICLHFHIQTRQTFVQSAWSSWPRFLFCRWGGRQTSPSKIIVVFVVAVVVVVVVVVIVEGDKPAQVRLYLLLLSLERATSRLYCFCSCSCCHWKSFCKNTFLPGGSVL